MSIATPGFLRRFWGYRSLCVGVALLARGIPVFGQVPVPLPVCYRVTELDYSYIQNSTNEVYDIYPIRLTDSGKFTGYIYNVDAPYSLLLYTPSEGFVDLGTYQDFGTRGLDINEAGVIAVGAQNFGVEKILTYTPGTGFTELPTLGGTGEATHTVRNINEAGQITGYSETPSGDIRAFRWSPGSTMEDLGTLGGWISRGLGLNEAGWVSGSSRDSNNVTHIFLAKPREPMHDLGFGIGGDINNSGVIVGADTSGFPMLLYDGKRVRVSPNFGVAQYSFGCLNDHNLFRGTYWDSRIGIGFTAFVGSEKHGIVDLNKLIPTNSGWVLTEATGMNNKCQVVGRGFNGQRNTMFRLDPVIPTLTIRHAATNVVLSWPETFFPLQLEEAESAEAPVWQAVSGVATNSAALPIVHTKRFYRLAIPPPPPPVQ